MVAGKMREVAATLPSPHPATPPGGFVPPEVAELNRRFPQLEILELLGKGGMGAVYKRATTRAGSSGRLEDSAARDWE